MFLLPILLSACLISARSLNGGKFKRANPKFVSASNGQFHVNGSALKFIGTNAYWLQALNTDQDISNTFRNISAAGIKVVRTWAFNDVSEVPSEGTWFQLIANGTTTINDGTNGLQRLDKVVALAEQHGIYLLLSLTNNWNPLPGIDNNSSSMPNAIRRDITPGTNSTFNRNYLSNDYGGMDAYVRHFGVDKQHDEFYTNNTIIDLFKNYTTNVVSRYVNSPAIFGWELANDPRCNSSLPSTNCTPQTVTRWHSILAQHVLSVDPNHLVSSGNHGFFCTGCPKLFPRPSPPPVPPPGPSAAATDRRRKQPAALTKRALIKERAEKRRRTREQKKRDGTLQTGGIRIRGGWVSTPTRRQDNDPGSAFDGSQGVDSEDILGIPQIGFSSFQLFPDQNNYGSDDPNLSSFDNTVHSGLDWIGRQVQTAQTFGKPIALTGFGLVTQDNVPDFVPFNSTKDVTSTSAPDSQPSTTGITDDQRDSAYQQWLQGGISDGINGMMQYQWGQGGLTAQTGTIIGSNATGTSTPSNGSPTSPDQGGDNVSPDDGYTTSGTDQNNVQGVLTTAAQNIGAD